jgi:hypothetical protein
MLIPGLLMLATFGLQRVESRLNRGCVEATDVAEFLASARPADMRTLARNGMPEALNSFQGRRTRAVAPHPRTPAQPAHATANPQFRPSRHADSV